jgi:acetyl-CoA C-acetyltransferase
MAVYILAGARTPIGSLMGDLSTISATELGSIAIKSALQRSGLNNNQIDEVFMGMVIQAGAGQAPARQAAIKSSLPDSVPCTTVNKVCGSGMQATILGALSIIAGDRSVVVAGGMENMSLAPHLLSQSRVGIKFGPSEVKDSMQWDGLWDVYSNVAMGVCAEECVTKYHFSREELDAFAIESFKRAQKAQQNGIFAREIAPVTIASKKGNIEISLDEGPGKVDFAKLPSLRPAFGKDGKLTAANSSTINDGASALVLGGDKFKDTAEFKIVSWSSHAQQPTWFTTAPVAAIQKCIAKAGVKIEEIDLFEINEAFSAVAMAAIKELKLDHGRVNIFGGGISLGHPIGSSGSRIVVTLMNAMKERGAKRGVASLCIGGGEALALMIERIR